MILVACVVRWGIWSNHQVSATNAPPTAAAAHKKAAPDADLSLFDRLLISLGMAEEPETPEDKGNPNYAGLDRPTDCFVLLSRARTSTARHPKENILPSGMHNSINTSRHIGKPATNAGFPSSVWA